MFSISVRIPLNSTNFSVLITFIQLTCKATSCSVCTTPWPPPGCASIVNPPGRASWGSVLFGLFADRRGFADRPRKTRKAWWSGKGVFSELPHPVPSRPKLPPLFITTHRVDLFSVILAGALGERALRGWVCKSNRLGWFDLDGMSGHLLT